MFVTPEWILTDKSGCDENPTDLQVLTTVRVWDDDVILLQPMSTHILAHATCTDVDRYALGEDATRQSGDRGWRSSEGRRSLTERVQRVHSSD